MSVSEIVSLSDLAPDNMPFVTLCTPTFNRRTFFPASKMCVAGQTYPRHRMEWLIVDDGTDAVGDLFSDAAAEQLPVVRYVHTGLDKMPLGAKRNYMNMMARGEILVYWDDDDYYPPTRVAHAVDMLLRNPEYRIAGTKSIHVYYDETKQVCRYGPYSNLPEMASAATFAFRRSYPGRFEATASLSEESSFTNGFTEPMLSLDPLQTILVFAHDQNSYDKRIALKAETYNGQFGITALAIDDFVRPASPTDWALVGGGGTDGADGCAALRHFFTTTIHSLLASYAAGSVIHKPDVMESLISNNMVPAEIAAEPSTAAAIAAAMAKRKEENAEPTPYVLYTADDAAPRAMTSHEVVSLVNNNFKKFQFAENERIATARERDAIAEQAERWKQECAKLRAEQERWKQECAELRTEQEQCMQKEWCAKLRSETEIEEVVAVAAAAEKEVKKRKFAMHAYEQCIAELVCEQRHIVE